MTETSTKNKGEEFYKTDAEWCGECGNEVPLNGKFEVQACSGINYDEEVCGARLLPCSSCAMDDVDCSACSLGG